jgi:NADH-quinone oxidoreductase chain G
MSDQTARLTIDGQQVQCPADWTVYQAATAAGIHIPTFCHHPKLVPVSACRTCLVEIEGVRALQTSCSAPVREGMVVRVHSSPAAVKARKAMIEFLLTNHPLDCPVCDKGGECTLQDQALADGPGQSRYVEEKRHKNKRYALGDRIVLDQERCVLCWRCIRFLDEWAGEHQLDLFGRGATTRLDTFPGRPLTSQWQGNTIDLCPVGALTSHAFRFEARVWELKNTPSICPLCSVGCNITLGAKNNKLRRITPRENRWVNDAWICDRGRFPHLRLGEVSDRAPERLTRPLIRRDGKLEPATWDEALDRIAQRLGGILQGRGPQAIAGLGSTRATNEANYLFQRFMRTVVGTNSIDHLARLPEGASPLSSLPGLEEKDAVLLLGFDPSTEAPLVELWLKKAVLRHGARVVIAQPLGATPRDRPDLARYGGPCLSIRPGSEAVLLHGLARAILDAGVDASAVHATNMTDLRTWLKEYTPERVERATGAPAADLQAAARLLAHAQRPIILYGQSFGLSEVSDRAGWAKVSDRAPSVPPAAAGSSRGPIASALANLALLLRNTEAAFVAGDNNTLGALEMGVVPDLLPGRQALSDGGIRSRLAGLWGGKLSAAGGYDWGGMLRAAQEAGLEAMWILEADPAADCQEAAATLGRVPFLVVQDQLATETSALAEVVLPSASFAETDGTFTNLTGRLQVIRAATRPPGLARPDWWIVAEVARRILDNKRQKAWEFAGAAEILGEIAKVVPTYRGVSLATIGEEGWQPTGDHTGSPPPARRAFVRPDAPAQADDGQPTTDHGPSSVVHGPSPNLPKDKRAP